MQDDQLNDQEIAAVLSGEPVGHLALSKNNQPYLVPVNFVYSGGRVYFHSRVTGQKVDCMAANDRVCFQVGRYGEPIRGANPCKFNYSFHSVIIEGRVSEVCDSAAKEEALELIIEKYAGVGFGRGKIEPGDLARVKVFAIKPATISGKKDS